MSLMMISIWNLVKVHVRPKPQTMSQLTGENDQINFYNLMTTVCNNITFNLCYNWQKYFEMSCIPKCSVNFRLSRNVWQLLLYLLILKKVINTIEVSSQALSLSLVNPGLIKTQFLVTITIYYQASRWQE